MHIRTDDVTGCACVALQMFINHISAGALGAVGVFLHAFVDQHQGNDEGDGEDGGDSSSESTGPESRCSDGSVEQADDDDDFW
jgi:hypothetical protein